jgi:SAM-dependent methyltransferase
MKNKTEWFETWFDSPYYHLLYKHRDLKEADRFVSNLVNYLNPPSGSRFLDLGCGQGRHSVMLNRSGFEVCGLDLSENSIEQARMHENEGLGFYVHDMRYPFRINYFDYVVNLFTSFGYFKNDYDDRRTILSAASNLRRNGVLIIDFLVAEKITRELVPFEEKQVEDVRFVIRRKIENKTVIKEIDVHLHAEEHHYREQVKLLSLGDFSAYFEEAGLTLENVFGDYNLNNFDPASSDRLIMLCRKS